jgi:hypothetical protein
MKQRSRWRFSSFATCLILTIMLTVSFPVWSQTSTEPVIDMHLHAKHADELGPPPLYLCAPFLSWPVKDTHEDAQTYFARVQNKPVCPSPLRSGSNDEDLMRRTLAILKSRNVTVAVTDGDLEVMEKWKQASEGRILPALPLSDGLHPNDLWCTDYKGEFQLSDRRYCYPLTVTDYCSRYLLLCEALESNREDLAFPAFERLFRERGLPRAIRTDNGVPFASPHGLFQLSKLSVWWLRLEISIERIRPGHPEQNGRHERMHLTLKKEATRPAGANILQQQAKFDAFLEEFNLERPHEALAMKCPAEVYSASSRPYLGIPDPHYPFHDRTVVVTSCGRLCLYNKKINLSVSLAGQAVGVKEVDHGIWLVSFMNYDLGYIDLEEKTLQPLDNPFGPKV